MGSLTPPGPLTNYSNPRCYMRSTRNCSKGLSREHYVSENVLQHFNGKFVHIEGMPWQENGAIDARGTNSLAAKILCERHNSALSPIDEIGGRAIQNIISAFTHVLRESKSESTKYFLISGEGLELWSLKTLIGLHSAKITRINREEIPSENFPSEIIVDALTTGKCPAAPMGLRITPAVNEVSGASYQMAPLYTDAGNAIIGLRMKFLAACFDTVIDRLGVRPDYFANNAPLLRPWILDFSGPRRTARIFVSWPSLPLTVTRVQIDVTKTELPETR